MTDTPKRDDAADVRATLDYAHNRHVRMVKELADAEAEIARLRALVLEARDLIKGDLVGLEWKRACSAFVSRANAAVRSESDQVG